MSNSNRNIVRSTGFSWILFDFKSGYDIFSKPWAARNGFDMLITVDMSDNILIISVFLWGPTI